MAGRVSVDGHIVTQLGTRVDPGAARIEVDGHRVATGTAHEYYAVNKPKGYITTASDPQGRAKVVDLVRSSKRLFSVGRLDADTTGLLLLTDDGELAHRLAHPRYGIRRTYVVKVRGTMAGSILKQLLDGVLLEDGVARAEMARIRAVGANHTTLEITLTEGRKREVRRMLECLGHPVVDLSRVKYGPLRLEGLRPGAVRPLTSREVGALRDAVRL